MNLKIAHLGKDGKPIPDHTDNIPPCITCGKKRPTHFKNYKCWEQGVCSRCFRYDEQAFDEYESAPCARLPRTPMDIYLDKYAPILARKIT